MNILHIFPDMIQAISRAYLKKYLVYHPRNICLIIEIIKAISFIRDKLPISVVSSMVGYHDVKAFCRAFKRIKGVPPSEYKKSQFLQP